MSVTLRALTALLLSACVAGAATLYQQEGTADDGPAGINAAGTAPAAAVADWTNWKYQTGGGSWSGVYAGAAGWLTESSTGDMSVEVEADIEMYCAQTISANHVYFHLGNIYSATTSDLTALITGSMTSNNGQWIGISFTGTGKTEADMEKVGGQYTGRILNGMQSDRDTWRAQNNQMDVMIRLFVNGVSSDWETPGAYGDGAHGTVHDTLWWLVNGGQPGAYTYSWQVKLLPRPHQPDGDYYLDPVVVSSPEL